ncbi:MAG: restriction endonuclease [Phycisphaerae bacterium]|nr:restriction endonuclease [Phycisphaerae bacterium]
MAIDLLPGELQRDYEVHEWKHACAVLSGDFPEQWHDMVEVLRAFRLRKADILAPGGGKSPISQWFDRAFMQRGWHEKGFETKIVVDAGEMLSPTHKVDCVKGSVALEIEWSNKDPFFDRDLNNFRLLFDLRAISVGVIITKSDDLRPLFEELNVWRKYGTSTTWMNKLLPRIEGGGGGGCPLLVFGIGKQRYVED